MCFVSRNEDESDEKLLARPFFITLHVLALPCLALPVSDGNHLPWAKTFGLAAGVVSSVRRRLQYTAWRGRFSPIRVDGRAQWLALWRDQRCVSSHEPN